MFFLKLTLTMKLTLLWVRALYNCKQYELKKYSLALALSSE